MDESIKYFNDNKYVVLSSVIPKEQCDQLVKHMFNLKEQGKTVQDEQCPLSDAVYGDPVFDEMLSNLAEPLGKHIGKELLPTYTYARIYRPGEVLKKHTDRPACQYSTTMTLGFDAKNIWPIFVDEQKEIPIILEPGDMLAYSGCDIMHWRPEFKGNWHVQVFFHYVDKHGPYASEAMDGRSQLGVPKEHDRSMQQQGVPVKEVSFSRPHHEGMLLQPSEDNFPGYIEISPRSNPDLMFTPEECEKVISIAKEAYASSASIGGKGPGMVNREIRSANIFDIPNTLEYRWIWDKIGVAVNIVNAGHFQYDIAGITHALQLIHYDTTGEVPGHYSWHVDTGPGTSAMRKISISVQLSDPNNYEGCDLTVMDHGNNVVGTKERGSFNIFPSYMPHMVSPITKGERYALVIWVHGSRRFK